MANANTETLLMIFIGITALAVLLQAGVLLGIFLTVRKAVKDGKAQADEFRTHLTPVLQTTKECVTTANELFMAAKRLVDAVDPKLKSAAAGVAEIVRDVHGQSQRLQASVDEVAQKARQQVDRVDNMATSVLNGLDRFGSFLSEAVHLPIRQVNGVVAAGKAIMDTLRAPAPPRPRRSPQPTHAVEDKDLFV